MAEIQLNKEDCLKILNDPDDEHAYEELIQVAAVALSAAGAIRRRR